MSKVLDKKLLDYVLKMSYNSLPFGGSKWGSSAQNLQNALIGRGIKSPKKLFYKYNLPDGMSPQEFQDKIALENFCRKFYTDFSNLVRRDKNLTLFEKIQIFAWVWKMRRDKSLGNMVLWEKEIRQKNPELANLKLENRKGSFVYGALFGFAPEDIEYYGSKDCDFSRADETIKLFKKYGINTTYVLNPSTADVLLTALQKEKE